MDTRDEGKRAAAEAALEHVRPGMVLGLGTGSTAEHFVQLLGRRVAEGLEVRAVPTSERTARLAAACGIALVTLEDVPEPDLAIDGADEIGPRLALVKGGGGALLREKIIAAASRSMLVIADASKRVAMLGAFPLPVEIVPFGMAATQRHLARLFAREGLDAQAPRLRSLPGGQPFLTDGGHVILDCALRRIAEPERLAAAIAQVPGVVEHGLFTGLAREALIGHGGGRVERLLP